MVSLLLGFVLLLAVPLTNAMCPANGDLHSIYVTVNGETDFRGNILSFDTNGRYLGKALNVTTLPARAGLDKLRGMLIDGENRLWVSSSHGEESSILIFGAPSLKHECKRFFVEVFSFRDDVKNPMLRHPYGLAFSPDKSILYSSNQNSVTVTRYYTGIHTTESKNSHREPLAPIAGVPQHPGVFVSTENTLGYTLYSLRGIAVTNRYLIVADVAQSEVLVFNRLTGLVEWTYDRRIKSPVQPVAFTLPAQGATVNEWSAPTTSSDPSAQDAASAAPSPSQVLYVTSKTEGVAVYKAALMANGLVSPVISGEYFRAASALQQVGPHRLLVADRLANRVYLYRDDGLFLSHFSTQFPDDPEFIAVSEVLTIHKDAKWCHQLSGDGTFKLSVHCIGYAFWLVVLLPLSVWMWRWFPSRSSPARIAASSPARSPGLPPAPAAAPAAKPSAPTREE